MELAVEERWVQQAHQEADTVEDKVRVRIRAMQERAEPRLPHAVELLMRHILEAGRGDGG